MAFQFSPKIVTSGLVLYLDAANVKSYPGTGTTWTDLSGNGNTGTLVNGGTGLTFSSSNSGTIGFDGVNDYIEVSSAGQHIPNLSAVTINCFVKFSNFAKTYNILLETIRDASQNYQISPMVRSDGKLAFYVFNTLGNQSAYDGTGTNTLLTNTWYMLTFVFQGSTRQQGYVNGLLDGSASPVSSIASSSQNARIGYSVFADRYPAMQLAYLTMYNRALSTSEILQNYNATKSRFGL